MIGESVEKCRLLGAEETLVDLIDGLLQLWVTLIVLARVVPTARTTESRGLNSIRNVL